MAKTRLSVLGLRVMVLLSQFSSLPGEELVGNERRSILNHRYFIIEMTPGGMRPGNEKQ